MAVDDFVAHGSSILQICSELILLPGKGNPPSYTYTRVTRLSARQIIELAVTMACDDEEYRYEEFLGWIRNDFDTLDHSSKGYIVAVVNGRIIGFIRVWNSPHNGKWMNDGIVVLPVHRNRGVGYRLVEEACRLAEEMGADRLYFHTWKTNGASIRIHEKAGFSKKTDDFINSYGSPRKGTSWEYCKVLDNESLRI